jgi:hypothetical protein
MAQPIDHQPEDSQRRGGRLSNVMETPLAHRPRLVTARDVQAVVHGSGRIGELNNRLAVLITRAVGTMGAAYVFVLIALVSFPQAMSAFLSGDTVVGITWLSQSFLQLVLLPIIIVGQNIISASQDARAVADHETLTALQMINVQQLQLLEHQEQILEVLSVRTPPSSRPPG